MHDKELYQHILGLTAPWTVSEIKLDMDSQEIRVRVQHPRGTNVCCHNCYKELACCDHGESSTQLRRESLASSCRLSDETVATGTSKASKKRTSGRMLFPGRNRILETKEESSLYEKLSAGIAARSV